MDVAVRQASTDDAAAWADVVLAASPHLVLDARSEAHEMRTDPPGTLRYVAEQAGMVVGVARLRTYAGEDHASLMVAVRPEHRRRGTGRLLLDSVGPALLTGDVDRVVSIVEDDPGSRIACERWGFRVVRELRQSALDPRTLPDPGTPPPGTAVVPLSDVGAEAVWRAHQQVARDDPSGLTLPMPWEDWADEWADPRARPDLGRAVLVDRGTGPALAAYTKIGAAGERAWSDMTGTLPEHRGRGLALLAKQHALQAAAAAGITVAITGNDGANLPMLAVNDRLGYRPVAAPALAERRLR